MLQDFRLAVRALRTAPIVTAAAVLSLALGIGANTAIFSLVNALLIRMLPVREPGRLALLTTATPVSYNLNYSFKTLDALRRHADAFDGVVAFSNCCATSQLIIGTRTETVDHRYVSGNFFSVVGVQPVLGRVFADADERLAGAEGLPAVIAYSLWQRIFNGDPHAIGMRVVVDRRPATIVGVLPPRFGGFEIGRPFEIALPLTLLTLSPYDVDTVSFNVALRLKRDVSLAEATQVLRAMQPELRLASMPAKNPGPEFLRDPLTLRFAGAGISPLRDQFARPLVALLALVSLVLLIAAGNVANLQLARGMERRHELSVRLALGAERRHLVRQLMTEALVVASCGAIGGLLLAQWASGVLLARLSATREPIVLDLALDWRMLAFTGVGMVATTVFFGVMPALQATHVAPIDALKQQGRGTVGERGVRVSNGLLVIQIAVSLALLVAAGLFVRSFENLTGLSFGDDRNRVLEVRVAAPTVPAIDRNTFYRRLVKAAAAVPGVVVAGGAMNPPLAGTLVGDYVVSDTDAVPPMNAPQLHQSDMITPGMLEAWGLHVVSGRDIDDRDALSGARVVLVNEAFVRRFFPGRALVGTPLAFTFRSPQAGDFTFPRMTVVGVVGDAVFRSIREPAEPTIYLPLAQISGAILNTYFFVAARSASASPALLAGNVRSALLDLNPDLQLTIQPFADRVNATLAQDRLVAELAQFFGAFGLLLAAVGLYGMTAYSVVRRRREVGVRLALGAAPAAIVRLVLVRGASLIAIGVAAGTLLSLGAVKLVAGLLYGIAPRDPLTLVVAVMALSAVGAAATWLPAWRASRIDPAEILRDA
jgi:putative ABC transport system permease protein